MKRLVLLFLVSCTLLIAEQISPKQLLIVTTKNWDAPQGSLQRYENIDGKWKKIGKKIKIFVGEKGLAWGSGLHTPQQGLQKKEGDRKAPAGIFSLQEAFGYEPLDINYPYLVMTKHHHCVDDSNSKWYNQVIDSREIAKDYTSHEVMRFDANYYRYGIMVGHNRANKPYGGSCIFIHIKDIPTMGCTAMLENEMVEILRWLNPASDPLLIQAPKSEIKRLLAPFGL